jgi:hypothetical protein
VRDQIRARVAMLAPSKAQPRRTCGGWGHASEALSWRSSRLNREWYELQHRRHQEDNENAAEPGPMGIAPFRMQSRADQVRGAERRPKAAMKWRPKAVARSAFPPSLSVSSTCALRSQKPVVSRRALWRPKARATRRGRRAGANKQR